MYQKIYTALKILLFSRKNFKFPNKNQILILDKMGSKKIERYVIPGKKNTILPLKTENLNLPIFIYSIFFIFKYGKHSYEVCFIKYVKPKIAITFIDNSYFYCDVFQFIKSCKLILVQNGRGLDRFKNIKSKLPRYYCDYYFVNSSYFIDYAKKYLAATYITSGSIIANSFPVANTFKKINKIQWVSHFRSKERNYNYNYNSFYVEPCQRSLVEIQEYAIKHQLNLEVIGRTDSEEEVIFFKKYINKMNFNFISNNLSDNVSISYTSISDDSIITGIDSQFLYETFGRGYRTAFLSTRGYYIGNQAYNFAWPFKTNIAGKFWINQPIKGQINDILDYLSHINQKDWKEVNHSYAGIIKHNYTNNIIQNVVNKEIEKN